MKSVIDFVYRIALNIAYPCVKVVWWILGRDLRGVYVAVWSRGRLLIIKNSYKRSYCMPGGMIDKQESPEQAAVRELREEVGIRVPVDKVARVHEIVVSQGRHSDKAYVVEVVLSEMPAITLDGREVIWAEFLEPHAVRALNLAYGHEEYLHQALRRHGGPPKAP